jgi:hypothetical protein
VVHGHTIAQVCSNPPRSGNDGVTEVTPADGGLGTAARFSAVLVKKDGECYVQSLRESVAQPPSNAEHLEDLEWLIGDWAGGAEKGEKSSGLRRPLSGGAWRGVRNARPAGETRAVIHWPAATDSLTRRGVPRTATSRGEAADLGPAASRRRGARG